MRNSVGFDIRQDRIDPIGLYDTVRRQRVATLREDNVRETSYAIWLENQTQWNEWLRSIVGLRGELYHFDVASNVPENSGSNYTSRLPGEPSQGVTDLHFHPMESRTFRAGILYNF
jgi:outer membrane receptor protein involved in Fe transport